MFSDENIAGKKIAIYTRVSTDDQAEHGYSLEGQLNKLRSYCKNYDLKIVGEYIDDGHSGRNIRRPAYSKMMKESQKWDAILVLKMDRIHRNQKNFMQMMDDLRKSNKEFISMMEKFDTGTAMGRFVMDIIQRIAQLESEQIGERIAFAMVEKVKTSEALMGHRKPFGYKWKPGKNKDEPGTLISIPDKLELIKKAFELYLDPNGYDPIKETDEGFFINTITGNSVNKDFAQRLRTRYQKEGHSFRSIGKIINKSEASVRYYLNNIFYAGYERYCHYFKKINNGFKPIISIEQWNLAQQKMRTNSRTHNYDPILIPKDCPESFKLNRKEIDLIPTINRAKHNYNF